MATVTGFSAARMLEIEAQSIVAGAVDLSGHLILTNHEGEEFDAGLVKGEDATALLTIDDTSTVDLVLDGSGVPGDPWVLTANVAPGAVAVGARVYPGMMIPWAGGSTAPYGYLLCEGQAISRITYASLFAVIGTTYGVGDGSTTFNLPDTRGRNLVGFDATQTEFDVMGEKGGSKTHTHSTPAHSHGLAAGFAYIASDTSYFWMLTASTGLWTANRRHTSAGTGVSQTGIGGGAALGGSTDSGGASTTGSGSSLAPYITARYIIAYGEAPDTNVIQSAGRGTTAQRDGRYSIPTTNAERVALANAHVSWFNTDLGWEESYYATTGLSGLTARGLISGTPSGWYPTGRGPIAHVSAAGTQGFSGAGNFNNYSVWGSGKSYKNTPGNASDGSSIFYRAASGAYLQMFLPGRYRLHGTMSFPAGAGTGTVSLRVNASGGSGVKIMLKPVVLISGYGQYEEWNVPQIDIAAGDQLFLRSDSGSWTLGGADLGWITAEYLGPPLIDAT